MWGAAPGPPGLRAGESLRLWLSTGGSGVGGQRERPAQHKAAAEESACRASRALRGVSAPGEPAEWARVPGGRSSGRAPGLLYVQPVLQEGAQGWAPSVSLRSAWAPAPGCRTSGGRAAGLVAGTPGSGDRGAAGLQTPGPRGLLRRSLRSGGWLGLCLPQPLLSDPQQVWGCGALGQAQERFPFLAHLGLWLWESAPAAGAWH